MTTAAQRGSSERAIANRTRHRSMPVLRGYIRRATVFEENAAPLVAVEVNQAPVVACEFRVVVARDTPTDEDALVHVPVVKYRFRDGQFTLGGWYQGGLGGAPTIEG